MTREETAQVLAILKATYPNSYKNMTTAEANGTITVWQTQFAAIPVEVIIIALHKVISTSVFPPTIADIRGMFRRIYIEADCTINDSADGITPEELEQCKRIKQALEPYAYNYNSAELTLTDILKAFPTNGNAITGGNKRITGGDK